MKRHTVLHLIHTNGAGGAETVLAQLVHRLDPRAWRCVAGVPEGGWLWTELKNSSAEVAAVPSARAFDLSLVLEITRLVREYDVDLIHAHLFGPALYGTIAARLLGLPVVCTLHGSVDLSDAHKWWGIKTRILGRRRNRYVAVTEALRSEAARELSLPLERIRVISNGVDATRFFPARCDALRRELGWSSDHLVIGSVGNVRRPKGYHDLLEAASVVRQRCPRCRFVILGDTEGDPDLYRELEERRQALDLNDTVAFAGFRDDINEGLNSFDIFVMSSLREGLPLAILQAMAVRLPIVATRCGGPQEILTHDRDALLTDPGDPRGLAECILSLAEDPDRRSRLAAAAYDSVIRRFTLDRTADQYAELYAECLERED